jgi:hypothetical protein
MNTPSQNDPIALRPQELSIVYRPVDSEIDLILQQAEVKPDADDTFETMAGQPSPYGATCGFWVNIGSIAAIPLMSSPTKAS